LVKFLEDNSFN